MLEGCFSSPTPSTSNEYVTDCSSYFDHIDWIYRIIHVPTVRNIFNMLYMNLENGQRSPYGYVAFISTIFASSAFFCSSSCGLFLDRDTAVAHARRLSLLAQDALTAADCMAHPTIETLQSLVILTQWLMPNIGAIATLRTFSSTLMNTARSLGIHLTDSPDNKRWRAQNEVNWVEVEVKRRIWWHIASTDWYIVPDPSSQISSFGEGM
jgi:Fungal specific transcription factor domain